MKALTKLVALLLLALGSFSAMAKTYYVSDCQAGAVAACVAGNDDNDGTSAAAPWKTTAKVASAFSGLAAGDNIRFARGGVWTNVAMGLRNVNASIAHPITFDAYPPAWYSGTKLPLLKVATSDEGTVFNFIGNPEFRNEGFVMRNLELGGSLGTASRGFLTYGGTNGVIVDNVTLRNFYIGFYCHDTSANVTIRNSTITGSEFTGLLSGCDNFLVENNIFDHNGFEPGASPVFNHSIYLGADNGVADGVTIRGNTITNSVQFDGQCQGIVVVGHGQLKNVVIEDNLIDESPNVGDTKATCWGISMSPGWGEPVQEKMENVVIRRNRVINVGGNGIEIGACSNCIVENNVIVKTDADPWSFTGIKAPWAKDIGTVDAPMGAVTIRNNSIYLAPSAPHEGSYGIQISRGSKHVLASNLIFIANTHADNACFNGESGYPAMPLSRFVAFDNNLCHRVANHGRYSLAYANLAAAQAAGFDVHGSAANPQLAATPVAGNKYSMALLAGSPAVGAAHTTYSSPRDIDKAIRSAPRDSGAFEYPGSSATAPGAPRTVVAKAAPAAQATVSFIPPLQDGRRPITGYTVSSSPAGAVDSNAGTNSLSHTLTGLSVGTRYTFTVKATNAVGTGAASKASNAIKAKP